MKLYLAGSDHVPQDYEWLLEAIRDSRPECITLEQRIDASSSTYWGFKHPLEQIMAEKKKGQWLGGEFTAGVVYARQTGVPLYCIDEYSPYRIAITTNLNEGNNFEILRDSQFKASPKHEEECAETERENWTRRNRLMAFAINYHFAFSGYKSMFHIGGRGHYDASRCLASQDLVIAGSIELIDAVEKTRTILAQKP